MRKLQVLITPRTTLIILTKRVIFLKQLSKGLLSVTGHFALNQVPLLEHTRNLSLSFVKTVTSKVKIPKHFTHVFFKKKKLQKPRHQKGELFNRGIQDYKTAQGSSGSCGLTNFIRNQSFSSVPGLPCHPFLPS
jgi:hypothetical protein